MKKLCIALFALLSNNVNAEWGEQWGSMVWGQSSANVPMMGGVGQFIFFGLLLVIGAFVTKRWGLIKTLPAVAVLSLIPLIVEADEIQLNTFQNGEVADADDVNENFNNIKLILQDLLETTNKYNCLQFEGFNNNGVCNQPKFDLEDGIISSGTTELFSFDTSDYVFDASTGLEVNLGFETWEGINSSSAQAICFLLDSGRNIVDSISVNMNDSYESSVIDISATDQYLFECTLNEPIRLNVRFNFS